jgi:phosphoglycolate phosphatase-like HAD superfamily hydrolase
LEKKKKKDNTQSIYRLSIFFKVHLFLLSGIIILILSILFLLYFDEYEDTLIMLNTPFLKGDFLALDFDGVIADSISECLIIGHNAFVEYSKKGIKSEKLSDLESNKAKEAKRLRQFIRSGEDYVYIQLILSENEAIKDQKGFDEFLSQNIHLKEHFFTLFYQERERFSVKHPESWILLNPLYKGMALFLNGFTHKNRLFIISTKKSVYINRILRGHQIDFPPDQIFYAEQNRSKKDIISYLLENKKIHHSRFHFVDDQVDTLIKVDPTRINRYLAGWGYNNKKQKSKAAKAEIPVLTLEAFYSSFSPVL